MTVDRPPTASTIDRLRRWGAYLAKRADNGLGYPRHSAFVAERVDGDRAYAGANLAADVAEVDAAVMTCPPHVVAVLLAHFARQGSQTSKATVLRISRRVFQSRLSHGVDQVHFALCQNARKRV